MGIENTLPKVINTNFGKERPFHSLFYMIHESYFMGLHLLRINEFKEKILNNFSGKFSGLRTDIEAQCRIAELLIMNPTPSLYSEIENESKLPFNKFRLLPFFAWVAKNNRTDLLNTECYGRLTVNYPEAAAEALKIAVAFGSKDYVKNAITGAIGRSTIRTAMSIASASVTKKCLFVWEIS